MTEKARLTLHTTFAATCIAAVAILAPPAQAEVNFKGKKVSLLVPVKEGRRARSVCALYSRPTLAKYLPGKPTVLVFNRPGGGTIKGSNWFERPCKAGWFDGTWQQQPLFTRHLCLAARKSNTTSLAGARLSCRHLAPCFMPEPTQA